MLGALAPALILVAVVRAIMTAEIRGRIAWRLGGLLLLNTTVAILIGLGVANVFSPGTGAAVTHPTGPTSLGGDIAGQLLENIPDSLVKPLVENRVIGVVIIAVAFGLAARRLTGSQRRTAEDLCRWGSIASW